jgi:hypothetical protein
MINKSSSSGRLKVKNVGMVLLLPEGFELARIVFQNK